MNKALSATIERLRQEMTSWSSIELRVQKDQVPLVTPARFSQDPFVRFEDYYVETARGQKLFDASSIKKNGSIVRTIAYCDGDRYATATYASPEGLQLKQIAIMDHFSYENQVGRSYRIEPLIHYFVEKTPLYEALPKAEPLGEGKALDRVCDLFLFRGVKYGSIPQDFVYALDHETATPLRFDVYPANSERQPDNAVRTWEAKSLDLIQAHHYFPLNSVNSFRKPTKSGPVLTATNTVVVKQIRYDQSFDSKMFWPTPAPGVLVLDSLKKTTHRIPGPEAKAQNAAPVPKAKAKETATTTIPARAEPPSTWATAAYPALLALGVALLVTAVVLRIRSR